MDKEKIQEGVRLILEGIGEDIHREGLVETPDRIARMYEELAAGYTDDAAVHLKKRFHVDHNDMVKEKDIQMTLPTTEREEISLAIVTLTWKKIFIFILFVNTICYLFTEQRQLPTFLTGKWWD